MKIGARWVAFACAIALLLVSASAFAELRVSASPIFGPDTPGVGNWLEVAVRIENNGPSLERGFIEVKRVPFGGEESFQTRAPFAVAGGAAVNVQLPVRTFSYGTQMVLRVVGEDENLIFDSSVPISETTAPFLLDASAPPRLANALGDVSIAVRFNPDGLLGAYHKTGKAHVLAGSLRVDAATGDPIVPERAAGYASATLVVMRTDQLTRLSGIQLQALANFVLAGGALALSVERPEDLRHETFVALVGGEAVPTQAPRLLRRTPGIAVSNPLADGHSDPGESRRRVYPGEEVDDKLSCYSGGNLRPTIFGAAASYGLGEVHILAFDPTRAPGVDDAWVKSRMVELLSHAWDRRELLVAPHGSAFASELKMMPVLEVLDPNQNSRWAIAVAAVLLLVYSVVAGPLNFSWAKKRKRPLQALLMVPVLSLSLFVFIVVLGVAAKGWKGKARHLTLLNAGAGMGQASVLRFRGFFTSGSRQLTVRATDTASVLDVATEAWAGTTRSLIADRDGVRLVDLSSMPWETLVVREDGFASIGGGISIVSDANNQIVVTNRMARNLRAVVLIVPSQTPKSSPKAYFFPKLSDGQSVSTSDGEFVAFEPWASGRRSLTQSDLKVIRSQLEGASSGLTAAWAALGSVGVSDANWWPDDVPIVLAQVDGGEGTSWDSGLELEADRVLIRVVGYGGVQ